jgi:hypothetical protein
VTAGARCARRRGGRQLERICATGKRAVRPTVWPSDSEGDSDDSSGSDVSPAPPGEDGAAAPMNVRAHPRCAGRAARGDLRPPHGPHQAGLCLPWTITYVIHARTRARTHAHERAPARTPARTHTYTIWLQRGGDADALVAPRCRPAYPDLTSGAWAGRRRETWCAFVGERQTMRGG